MNLNKIDKAGRHGESIGVQRSPHSKKGLLVRLGLVVCALASALAFAFIFVSAHKEAVKADTPIVSQATPKQPWGEAIDGAGHLWVAQPDCDASPVCTNPLGPGAISEYDPATMNKLGDFIAPAGINPIFVAPDAAGNIWFTDPSHTQIGKFVPGATPTWTVYKNAAVTPYDLVFDSNGKIWFTDFFNGAVGLFDPAATAGNEYLGTVATPTKSVVYGITKAADGTIWVAENNTTFVASFTPAATTTGLVLKEHKVLTNQQHLITTDKAGNVWFTTGFNGQIGKLVPGTDVATTYCVSNAVTSPHMSGIAMDSTGKVWFTDSLNQRIGYLDPATYKDDCNVPKSVDGVFSITVASGSHPHDGLIVDKTDNVYFTQQYKYSVNKIAAGTAVPPPTTNPTSPTAKTWYFAEGRVGGGFREFITIANPSPANECIVNLTYLLESGAPITKKVTVKPASRWTEDVGNDLGRNFNAAGLSVATIAANDTASPCLGFAAERPMYFNWHAIKSGTDVVGATHTANQFYFADIPTGNGYTAFITILNPPGGKAARVTATYYAGGKQVAQQAVSVAAGTRGTLAPNQAKLPAHTAAIITSDQPIVVERPAYFQNINGGFAGTVTGASSVVGSPSPQNQWFLAEGYAGQNGSGGKTQENLVIANVDPANAVANVTINLEYVDGSKHTFQAQVAPKSQLIWDVNKLGVNASSKEVSVDISSTGAGIVVMRQMYFNYAHTINGSTLSSTGGTEVTGQVGTYASYTFAEGYNNVGYNEWLTLQNPTGAAEKINIVLVNSLGNTRTYTVTVPKNTRYTFDVTAYVRANMAVAGDFKSYEISMTVQSSDGSLFVAERPQYFNTSGSTFPTQGGTAAFGYSGN